MGWDIAVIIFSITVVVGVIVRSVIRKKQGKSSCGCDCASCQCSCQRKDKTE
ncbi:MAG: FeoB-associated Cys-rich membrane protein [Clostridiales bacterium]|nr:FeoB-associated Cys-rich membrane protein [Clostridiales bacterium]